MLIAIDFDDTLTADPVMWRLFIDLGQQRGHRFVCITARRYTEENREIIDDWMQTHGIDLSVYYSSLGSKLEYAKKLGMKVDIWIDDDPKRCALGH